MKSKQQWTGLVMGVVLSGSSLAWGGEQNAYMEHVTEHEWQGAGLGGLIGVLADGPPGAIIGLAGGSLLARHNDLEDSVVQMEGDLARSHEQIDRLNRQQGDLQQRLQRHAEIQANRLQAIAEGFSLNIHFRTGSAQLETRYQGQLDRLADSLRAFPELQVHIDAFADVRGRNDFNQQLSERRARVVQRSLAARGIPATRMHLVALGERSAEYPQQDPEGMGFDRRVLLYFSQGMQ